MLDTKALYALICVFAPLAGCAGVGVRLRTCSDRWAQIITCASMGFSFLASVLLIHIVCFGKHTISVHLLDWIHVGQFHVTWGLRIDPIAALMTGVVTSVSWMVHIYSIGYMHGDKSVPRFMAYLSLFTFLMLMLITAPNLVQLFFGWEGVGLASYLLIGFWHEKESANAAAMKAFLVNRVADIFLALGIFAAYVTFGSVTFTEIFTPNMSTTMEFALPFWGSVPAIPLICLLLFIGAMGKSAQLGLHVWLPDAMEGPTPVSALIHAATMVTAGIFLMARLSPLLEQAACVRTFILIVGALTTLFAATIACTQNDIKKVIAYSTCSQLGLMFTAIGVSAYSLAIFHLMTHAFFKALLFLGAGSVIHAFSGEQNLQSMGGIWRRIPFTYAMMWIGSLALAGIPYLSGYYSKDPIMEALWASSQPHNRLAFVLSLSGALLTAFYSWRLLFLAFHGQARCTSEVLNHVHESPLVMTGPLVALALGAVFVGFLTHGLFVTEHSILAGSIWTAPQTLHDLFQAMHHIPTFIALGPLLVAIGGITIAFVFYQLAPQWPGIFAEKLRFFYHLSFYKWYIDDLYDILWVRPTWALGRLLWNTGDGALINGLGPDGIAQLVHKKSQRVSQLQTGYVYHYALAMLLGIFIVLGGITGALLNIDL